MRVEWQDLAGVELHIAAQHTDERGTFVKHYSTSRPSVSAQQVCSSFNRVRGTLRGLHVQLAPHLETKLVWSTAGELWDVLVDARPEEPTYGCWTAIHLSASEGELLSVPAGVAHGYQTLVDGTSVAYVIDGGYSPDAARTLAWNDPTLAIAWPLDPTTMSLADRKGMAWPLS